MEVGKHKRINQIDLLYHPHFHIALGSHLQYHRTAITTKLEQGDCHFEIICMIGHLEFVLHLCFEILKNQSFNNFLVRNEKRVARK